MADLRNCVVKRDDYYDRFSRIVCMVTDLDRAMGSEFVNPTISRLFLADYFRGIEDRPDLMKCLQELTQEPNIYSLHANKLHVVPSESSLNTNEFQVLPDASSLHTDEFQVLPDASSLNMNEFHVLPDASSLNTNEFHVLPDASSLYTNELQELLDESSLHMDEFQELPADESSEENCDVGHPLSLIHLRGFLLLLGELRNQLVMRKIDSSSRCDILRHFLNIFGPCRELIVRVLYYLYPPCGMFVQKEAPNAPSLRVDSRQIYPSENLAFSLINKVDDKLEEYEYSRYVSIWKNVRQRIKDGAFDSKDSMEAWRNFTEVLSPYKTLMRRLSKLPWAHRASAVKSRSN